MPKFLCYFTTINMKIKARIQIKIKVFQGNITNVCVSVYNKDTTPYNIKFNLRILFEYSEGRI